MKGQMAGTARLCRPNPPFFIQVPSRSPDGGGNGREWWPGCHAWCLNIPIYRVILLYWNIWYWNIWWPHNIWVIDEHQSSEYFNIFNIYIYWIYIYIYWIYIYMYIYIYSHIIYIDIPVPHQAVAEVSMIGNYRRGELLWCMDGRANPLMDRKLIEALSLSLSVSLSLPFSVSPSLCVSLCLPLSIYLSIYLSLVQCSCSCSCVPFLTSALPKVARDRQF